VALVITAALCASRLAAQVAPAASIAGRVTDAQSGQPIPGAQVRIASTNLGAVTGDDGRYVVRAAPVGNVEVRVSRIGFAEQKRVVSVAQGTAADADFAMARVAVELSPVVTTATGEQRRVEIANAVTTVDAANVVRNGGVTTVGDVLATRSPSVNVLQGGMIGAGVRVRIRGTSSLSLSNEPIYIVDGVRLNNDTTSLSPNVGVGGTTPSAINELNPDEIESLDVIRGPSAATLYGTDAANGVIIIKTKRGRVGKPQVGLHVEQGLIQDNNDYPTNFSAYGHRAGNPTTTCYLREVATGGCTIDSVVSFNVLRDRTATPLQNGYRQLYGAQISGGSAGVRYFIAGDYDGQEGVYRIPPFDQQRMRAAGTSILPEWNNPNVATRASGRVNVDIAPSDNLDVAVSAGYTQNEIRLPQNDNNITGLFGNIFTASGRSDLTDDSGQRLWGYANFLPGDIFQQQLTQNVNRFTGSVNPQYRPLTWLTVAGDAGIDFTSRVDAQLCRFAECPDFATNRQGFKENDRSAILLYTLNGRSTATLPLFSYAQSRTSLGVQYTGVNDSRNGSGSSNLPIGTTTTTAGSVPFADEATTLSRTIGAYLEEQVSVADRLFVTGGARMDRSSAFGVDFGNVVYPKASVSYVISDEPVFPKPAWLDQLRLRTAVGSSGVRPGTTDALKFFVPAVVTLSQSDLPGVVAATIGNPHLKPERATEIEAGIDAMLFDRRYDIELTYYDKTSRDALIQRTIPPSLGPALLGGVTSVGQFENLGKVSNRGFEFLLRGQPIQRRSVAWDFSFNGSFNKNRIVSLGAGIPPIIGTTINEQAGFPVNAYFARAYTYNDANHDGLLSASEVTVDATSTYQGNSLPTREFALVNGVDILDHMFRLQATLDHKGGNKLYNNTDRIRCQSFNNCSALVNRGTSLEDQARVIALRYKSPSTLAGYMQQADFTRLREASITYNAPDRYARAIRGRSLSLTFSGRNLGLWTKYKGIDPESTYGNGNIPRDFLTQPPLTYYTLRLNVGY